MDDTTEHDDRPDARRLAREADREADRIAALREQTERRDLTIRERLTRSMHATYRNATVADLLGVPVEVRVGDEWPTADAASAVARWLNEPVPGPTSLFLVGPQGVGKTHAAAAAALRFLTTNSGPTPAAWWTVAGLLDALRPDANTAAERERIWDEVKTVPLLVLDDLAHTRASEWAAERMWILADHRAGDTHRTIVTTNATFRELEQTWGRAAMDRFGAGIAVVRFAGESKRTPLW